MVNFLVGIFIGAIIGFLAAALIEAGSDDRFEEPRNRREKSESYDV